MEELIKQAFLHIDGIGQHVHEGHYDLIGPDGEIILPQVWEVMVQPDWTITMHMWPLPELKPKHAHPPPPPGGGHPGQHGFPGVPPPPPMPPGVMDVGAAMAGMHLSKKPSKKDKKRDKGVVNIPPPPMDPMYGGHMPGAPIPPPPMPHDPRMPPPPPMPPGMDMRGAPPGVMAVHGEKKKKKPQVSPFLAYMAGGSAPTKSLKGAKKTEELRYSPTALTTYRSGSGSTTGSSSASKSNQGGCLVM